RITETSDQRCKMRETFGPERGIDRCAIGRLVFNRCTERDIEISLAGGRVKNTARAGEMLDIARQIFNGSVCAVTLYHHAHGTVAKRLSVHHEIERIPDLGIDAIRP